ncbi:hypothetical protein [Nostoc sp. NOS(2021)]|uniref:hypothetical protein n=1 Tax=Nostoc sp. NOS(2021) TaxID=2815407 RepID=UPI0025FBB222|nr:hypothetical protein [Nostoc sp. NOS(2021)]
MKYSDFIQENSVMLLIDHQVGTMKLIKNLPLTAVEKNTLALAKVAKVLKIPVVLTSSLNNAVSLSIAEVASSKTKMGGLFKTAQAIAKTS